MANTHYMLTDAVFLITTASSVASQVKRTNELKKRDRLFRLRAY